MTILLKHAPDKVFTVGIPPQIKNPKSIAKTRAKYFRGVTNDTRNIYMKDLTISLLIPNIPNRDKIKKSLKDGITHPNGIVNELAKVIANEKYKDINHTGSVFEELSI